MKRYKVELSCGLGWSKEELVEDENGNFVKYTDLQEILAECMEWNWAGGGSRKHSV